MPEEYLLLRKLKMFSGKYGALPLLVEGGYYDQPHFTVRVLEACIEGERRFEDFLKQREYEAVNKFVQSQTNLSDGNFDISNIPVLDSGGD